jgi:hypothetical protein
LSEAGLPVIWVETRHMKAALSAQINKRATAMMGKRAAPFDLALSIRTATNGPNM